MTETFPFRPALGSERLVTGEDVAVFLGHPGDPDVITLANAHVETIAALVYGYTRGQGFEPGGRMASDLASVVTTATARLLGNPEQVNARTGSVSVQGGFTGFSLAELTILHRYRKRAA